MSKLTKMLSSFRRLTSRGLLIIGLSLVHLWATFDGMRELIPQAGIKLDDFSTFFTVPALALILVVSMLTAMIVFTLHLMFSDHATKFFRASAVVVYLFLEVVSVGLGFGFYWKVLNSTESVFSNVGVAEGVVESAFTRVSRDISSAAQVLATAASYSRAKSQEETTKGNTCLPLRSGGGCGPICNLRKTDADNAEQWNSLIKDRVTNLNRDIQTLKERAGKASKSIKGASQDEAVRSIQQLNSQIAAVTTDINRLSGDPNIKAIAQQMAERAARQDHPAGGSPAKGAKGGGGTFRCIDPVLSGHLTRASEALQSLPQIKHVPQVAAEIGSEATKAAFFRLLAWLGSCATGDCKIAANHGIDPITGQQVGQDGLTQKDLLALVIAIAIDVCLLFATGYKDRPSKSSRLVEMFNQFDEKHDVGLAWRLLGDVHLRTMQGHYVAIPDTRNDKSAGFNHLNAFFDILEANREVSRAWLMWPGRVKKRYAKRQQEELSKYEAFNVYYVPKPKMAELLEEAERRVRGQGSFAPPQPEENLWSNVLTGQVAPGRALSYEPQDDWTAPQSARNGQQQPHMGNGHAGPAGGNVPYASPPHFAGPPPAGGSPPKGNAAHPASERAQPQAARAQHARGPIDMDETVASVIVDDAASVGSAGSAAHASPPNRPDFEPTMATAASVVQGRYQPADLDATVLSDDTTRPPRSNGASRKA